MSDYINTLTSMYREEVARQTVAEETVDRRTAIAHVIETADAMIGRGDLHVSMHDVLHATLMKIDERDGASTDVAIKEFAAGQYDLEIDNSPLLSMVVTLGAGKRKIWRDFTADDLVELDRLRYRNVASVQAAYAEWRESFDALLPELIAGGSIGRLATRSAAA